MGKWNNRRWMPRRKYYPKPPEPIHRVYYNESESAAAFNNAKEQFPEAVNGLPCDTHLPDPGMYIDEIDWNPRLDPEMIMDLDREYFNPDDGRDNTMHNSVAVHSVGRHGNHNNGDNKWEGSELKGAGASNDAAQVVGTSHGVGTRGKPAISSQNVGPAKEKGWGIAVGNSWGGDPRKTNVHESRNFNSVDAPCARTLHQGNGCGNDKGWGNCGDRNWGWKQSGNHNSEPKYFGF
ncbi:hypothetical protein Acr_10g0003390 [Actinidia rufa]|uniref:Uncharacterized protein n=1 Tax=Actinidia rufa TaxID=165716 RepID=A0A7J0F8C0_9ERIC|nr:hypothetical protein Acr_10g0003390 [Actinidia rufa]